ncbi:unnamed protein product [Hymenolepis diminuta]|uniref:Uncharacterized protein n=1 Tax=Hymenolepis diminuta TaxID=6216 RepID=A0A564ZAR3_HYMDI|nr:unnamed protein product [Hymenolepis diminuta]
MPTSVQPHSPLTKLQIINQKLRPSFLPKATFARKCNTCNLLAVNNKSQAAEPPPTTVNYCLQTLILHFLNFPPLCPR